MQDVIREPVELIDSDLDAVAGGFLNVNIGNNNLGTVGVGNAALLITGAVITVEEQKMGHPG